MKRKNMALMTMIFMVSVFWRGVVGTAAFLGEYFASLIR